MKGNTLIRIMLMSVAWLTCLSIHAANANPDSYQYGDYYYVLNDYTKTAYVTYSNGTDQNSKNYTYVTDIVIPPTIKYGGVTYTVTEIGKYAFNGTTATSAVIPSTVTKINERSFYMTKLKTIELPTTITELPSRSLAENYELTTIKGLDNVKIIHSHALSGNSALSYLSFPNVEYIYGAAFYSSTGLQAIDLGTKLKSIGYNDETSADTFFGCYSLKRITLPASLTEICGALAKNFPSGITITCNGTTPPVACNAYGNPSIQDSENNVFFNNATLLVSSSAESTYKSTAPWSYFKKINPVLVTRISFSVKSVELPIGKSAAYTPTISPSNATTKEVTFSSSNTSVATVREDGYVTAVATGTATITATAKDGSEVSGSFVVKVFAPALTGISLDKTSLSIKDSETITLKATLIPTGAQGTVTWTSSNTGIAKVDANGLVSGVKPGYAEISAKCGSYSAACGVTVTATPVTSISLNKTTVKLNLSETETLVATVLPDNATYKTVTWSSSNTSIATVDSNGKVTAIDFGSATITAKSDTKSATCNVKVESGNANPKSVKIGDYYYELNRNAKTASVTFDNGVAVANYTNLAYIDIPESVFFSGNNYEVNKIGRYAFRNCPAISLKLPSTIEVINTSAFYECAELTGAVIIPNSVYLIYQQAFSGCKKIDYIRFENPVPASLTSTPIEATTPIYVPTGSGDRYRKSWSKYSSKIFEIGDANENQSLTVTDAVATTNYIVGAENTTFNEVLADINFDDRISISDATQIISAVLEYNPSGIAAISRRMPSAKGGLVADNFMLGADMSATVGVKLESDVKAVALQADLRGVDGLSITGVELSEALAATHSLRSAVLADGTVRVVIYSGSNEAISLGDEALFTIAVSGDGGRIEASNILASTATADESVLGFTGGECAGSTSGTGFEAANNRVKIYGLGREIVVAGAEGREVRVTNVMGMLVDSYVADGDRTARSYAPGIYIVNIENTTVKIIIR